MRVKRMKTMAVHILLLSFDFQHLVLLQVFWGGYFEICFDLAYAFSGPPYFILSLSKNWAFHQILDLNISKKYLKDRVYLKKNVYYEIHLSLNNLSRKRVQ